MRWQSKPVLAGLFFLFCLFTFITTNRRTSPLNESSYDKYLPPLQVQFTEISNSAIVVYGMRDSRVGNMGHSSVRFLVLSLKNVRFHCKFPSGAEVPAKAYEFSENHGMLYGVYYLNCQIPRDEIFFESVKLSDEEVTAWVDIPIDYVIPKEHDPMDYQIEYGICIPVLFGSKYTAKNLIEFMELNALLGTQKVTIYTDGNLPNDMRYAFNYYSKLGMLQEIKFNIPLNYTKIWYHGQLAVISDCLVRYTGVARYLAFHDIDEYLVPTQEINVVNVLRQKLTENVGSLRVPTQYMSSRNTVKGELITLEAYDHPENPDPTFTKCVLRPEMVFEQGIHHTSRVIQDHYTSPQADDKDLLIYHYKQRGMARNSTRIADIYGKKLLENYNIVVKYLGL